MFNVSDDLAKTVFIHTSTAMWKSMLTEFRDAVSAIGGKVVEKQSEQISFTDNELDEIGARVILARASYLSPAYDKSIESLTYDIQTGYARTFSINILKSLDAKGIYLSATSDRSAKPDSLASRAKMNFNKETKSDSLFTSIIN